MLIIGQTVTYNSSYYLSNATGLITYIWSLTLSSSNTINGSNTNSSVNITWNATGAYSLKLMATNCGDTVETIQVINVTNSLTLTLVLQLTPTLVLTLAPTLVLTLVQTNYYNLISCSGGLSERSIMNILNLLDGTVVKLATNQCYTISGTSTTITTNVISSVEDNCSSCLGTLTPTLALTLTLTLTLQLTLALVLTPTLTLTLALTLTLVPTLALALTLVSCTNYMVTNDSGSQLSYQFTCCSTNALVQDTINLGQTKCICAVANSFSSQNGEVTFTSQGACNNSDTCFLTCEGVLTLQLTLTLVLTPTLALTLTLALVLTLVLTLVLNCYTYELINSTVNWEISYINCAGEASTKSGNAFAIDSVCARENTVSVEVGDVQVSTTNNLCTA